MRTAGIRRVDRVAVAACVEGWARELAVVHPEVRRVVWYGSFVSGVPTPRSDADLCVVVADGTAAGPRHLRGTSYLPRTATRVPFDLTVFTEGEFATLAEWAPAWARAISNGRVLVPR